MLNSIYGAVRFGLASVKIEPEMVLTAARDIFVTVLDRHGNSHDLLYANEGDQIRVELPDPRNDESFICTNLNNFDEIGTVDCADLDDTLKEYT